MCAHCGHTHIGWDGEIDIDWCRQCVDSGAEHVCRDFDC